MAVIRIGDKVAPRLEMHRVGEVVELYDKKHTTMLVGGTLSTYRVAVVRLQGQEQLEEWRVRDVCHVD